MSDKSKTYGEIAEERKLAWEKSLSTACDDDCWEAIAEAVIDEYKRRSELDTKPLPVTDTVVLRDDKSLSEVAHEAWLNTKEGGDCFEDIATAVRKALQQQGWVPSFAQGGFTSTFDATKNFIYDEGKRDWFPRVHADGENYVEDSIG